MLPVIASYCSSIINTGYATIILLPWHLLLFQVSKLFLKDFTLAIKQKVKGRHCCFIYWYLSSPSVVNYKQIIKYNLGCWKWDTSKSCYNKEGSNFSVPDCIMARVSQVTTLSCLAETDPDCLQKQWLVTWDWLITTQCCARLSVSSNKT